MTQAVQGLSGCICNPGRADGRVTLARSCSARSVRPEHKAVLSYLMLEAPRLHRHPAAAGGLGAERGHRAGLAQRQLSAIPGPGKPSAGHGSTGPGRHAASVGCGLELGWRSRAGALAAQRRGRLPPQGLVPAGRAGASPLPAGAWLLAQGGSMSPAHPCTAAEDGGCVHGNVCSRLSACHTAVYGHTFSQSHSLAGQPL